MAKQMSNHAAAAKQIRTELKKHGIKASVRSESYSMGSSVHVKVENQPPWVVKRIEAFANQYQYGHFDGMIDLYEHSNSRDDIPQVKFVFVDNEYSDELRQAAWDYARARYADCAEGPADVDAASNYRAGSEWGSTWVYRVLSGVEGDFWKKPTVRVSVEDVKATAEAA